MGVELTRNTTRSPRRPRENLSLGWISVKHVDRKSMDSLGPTVWIGSRRMIDDLFSYQLPLFSMDTAPFNVWRPGSLRTSEWGSSYRRRRCSSILVDLLDLM
jgi:hypothetical protein